MILRLRAQEIATDLEICTQLSIVHHPLSTA